MGSIPAWAGEPPACLALTDAVDMDGSIPAWAGEPVTWLILKTISRPVKVYPRVGGGTVIAVLWRSVS